ncbi:helix-turn-helix transcriptional regulator [Streptomyces sp. NBC_00233]|uniref:ArsR/SmtB family transcription factor n=1 Tax=Streptomyces sp. NBC_00233 TaxID=2975686 RepID=UPI00224EB7C5|nr:metalloregulator ArsR/SmtB family transcription factor [Streptomyces sp. NBC_00233]MCX5232649.1 helix-turn-helix domain-containing protein [Streptomyces sp. NBC_00233]
MRIRVAATIGTAAETLDSVKLLHAADVGLGFRRWQVSVRGRLEERVRPLLALLPPQGPDVDVWSLAGDSVCIEEAVDRLLGAPRDLLRIEFENIHFRPAHRAWARNLVDGDREAWLQVTTALRACHGVTVAPYWGRVRSHLAEVRATYANAMAEGGVDHLLRNLGGPMLHWRPPVLELEHPHEADVHLNGRGLVIAPTMFSAGWAELMQPTLDPAEAPVLAVPTVTDALVGSTLWDGSGLSTAQALEDLLGRTRAAILEAVAVGRSTTDLARRLGISPATVSHHTSVLRNSGLVTTRREGKAVLHTVTSMGMALLEPGSRPL